MESWLTPRFSRASSKDSKRMLEVSDRSLGGFWHNGYPKDTSRKLRINFQISTFMESGLTPGFSRASSKESKRTLKVPERSLGGFGHNGCSQDTSRKLSSIFISLPSWKVD
jgi:hypothetical protein